MMTTISFNEKMAAAAAAGKRLCLGLDPVANRIPEGVSIVEFCRQVVEATSDTVAAFKPNIAFFEGRGPAGLEEYAAVIDAIKSCGSVPIIGDMKRGDIGATNLGYIQAAFDYYGFDAITVHPYLGGESLNGFLDQADRGILVLCRTSNPGAGEFQDLIVEQKDRPVLGETRVPLYQVVARNVSQYWTESDNCGLVVGATYPKELARVREIAPDTFLLIPGVGAQGGDLETSVKNAHNPKIGADFVINVSSGILYAFAKGQFQTEPANFAEAAAAAANDFDQQIRDAVAVLSSAA